MTPFLFAIPVITNIPIFPLYPLFPHSYLPLKILSSLQLQTCSLFYIKSIYYFPIIIPRISPYNPPLNFLFYYPQKPLSVHLLFHPCLLSYHYTTIHILLLNLLVWVHHMFLWCTSHSFFIYSYSYFSFRTPVLAAAPDSTLHHILPTPYLLQAFFSKHLTVYYL